MKTHLILFSRHIFWPALYTSYFNLFAEIVYSNGISLHLQIRFEDPDNNGQVTIDLETTTERQICLDLGYDVPGKL